MSRPKVNLKDPILAAILAFLLPGFGHFYQRRLFKGMLYCTCILGTFFTGLRIGHGQVVYFHWKQPENRTYAYLCQVWVGLPALPALAQSHLRSKEAFDANYISHPVSESFEGMLFDTTGGENRAIGSLTGTIELRPQNAETAGHWIGIVTGTLTTPEGVARPIHGEIIRRGAERGGLDPEVAPWPQRRIIGRFNEDRGDRVRETVSGRLEGAMPRSLLNSFEAPLQDPRSNDVGGEASDLDRAHRELGGRFELGVVYTMIAGLLNILAIYDAFEGPAYEDEEEEAQADKPPLDPKGLPPE